MEDWKFGIFPSEICRGRNPIQQSIIAWLWFHKDKEWYCFPSQKTLSTECGISVSSLNAHLQILETDGIIAREMRFKEWTKEKSSTLYMIQGYSAKWSRYSAKKSTRTPPNGVGTPPGGEEPEPVNQNQLQPEPITKGTRGVSVIEKGSLETPLASIESKSPELAEKLREFVEFRKQIRKPLKPVSFPSLVKKLVKDSGGDVNTAIEIIEQSIANGWQWLFPLKWTNPGKPKIYSETF